MSLLDMVTDSVTKSIREERSRYDIYDRTD